MGPIVLVDKHLALARFAEKWVGVTEQGGDNKGQVVELFQRTVDGKAQGEAWCCAFVQTCLAWIDAICSGEKTPLKSTEWVKELWEASPKENRVNSPQQGFLAVWLTMKGGQATGTGHVGIVHDTPGDMMVTIEGNTGPGAGVEREGDGVYRKLRPIAVGGTDGLVLQGFLNPWR